MLDAGINVPILVGEDIPERWLEVSDPLGISAQNFQRVKLGKTLNVKKLYIYGPSVANYLNNDISFIRNEDICELRVLLEIATS